MNKWLKTVPEWGLQYNFENAVEIGHQMLEC
jgi:hypothetical protein